MYSASKVTSRKIAQQLFRDYSRDDEPNKIDKTLAIIKPDGAEYYMQIIDRIYQAGFQTIQTMMLKLTFEQASEFYQSEYGTTDYPMKVVVLSSGPIFVMCLSKVKAIKYWQILMGPGTVERCKKLWPGSLRALYGSTINVYHDLLHGSENEDKARFEIKFFFPNMIIEPIIRDDEAHCYLQRYVNPLLFKGLHMVAKTRPSEPILALAKWLLINNPNRPIILSAVECDFEKIGKCMQDCLDVNCLQKNKDYESISECSSSGGEEEEQKEQPAQKVHDPDLIGRCLQCPHCAKILRIIYYANSTKEQGNCSDDASQSCTDTPSTGTSDVVIPSSMSLNADSCVNCVGCNEVFIIRGNLVGDKPKTAPPKSK